MNEKIKQLINKNPKVIIVVAVLFVGAVFLAWPRFGSPTEDSPDSLFEIISDRIGGSSEEKPIPMEEEIPKLFRVVNIIPNDNQTSVSENLDKVAITFKKSPDETDKARLSFEVDPPLKFSTEWISIYQVNLNIEELLQKGTKYTIAALYMDEEFYRAVFQTSQFDDETRVQKVEKQMDQEAAYSKSDMEAYQKWPFLTILPLESQLYTIVYDYTKESFRIGIHLHEDAPEYDKQFAINSALGRLKSVKIDPEDWGGYYVLYRGQPIPKD